MIFENIKLKYYKISNPLQIEYFQTRKPNLFEFLILQIIIDHPDRSDTMQEILKKDFNISEITIFQKTFIELKKNKLIKEKVLNSIDYIVSRGDSNFNSPIEKFDVEEEIKKVFKTENYVISQETKNKRVFVEYDFINEEFKIKDTNSEKNFTSTYNYEMKNDFSKNLDKKDFENILDKYLHENNDWFSSEDILKDVFFNNDNTKQLNNLLFSSKINSVVCEKQISLEIKNNGAVNIISENQKILKYFQDNESARSDLFKSIIEQYNHKILEIFEPKRGVIDQTIFDEKIFSHDNLPDYERSELLLLNNDDYFAEDKVLNFKKLTKNTKYIIIYNSKANTSLQEFKDGKQIFYLNQVSDDTLINSTVSFLNFNTGFTNFALVKTPLTNLNFEIPIFKKINNTNDQQRKVLESVCLGLTNTFKRAMNTKEYSKAVYLFEMIRTLNHVENAFEVIEEKLISDISEGEVFENFGSLLKLSTTEAIFKKYETIMIKILSDIGNSKNHSSLPAILGKYSIFNKEVFKKILFDVKSDFNLEQIIKMDEVLKKMDIDIWKFNIFNCLKVLAERFVNNPKFDSLNLSNSSNSLILKNHIELFNNYIIMTSYFNKKQYDEAAQIFASLFENLINVLNNLKNIKNDFETYYRYLGDKMASYYSEYNTYLEGKIALNIKTPIWNIRSENIKKYQKLNGELNKNMPKILFNYPLEFKIAYVNKEENSSKNDWFFAKINVKQLILDIYAR
ncbi:hypothetical protein [Spiroplasma endosymbiont of Panorpa germanica]|uniref:hypothetical protein n=1 Tax=Spiroplasma endosymbiont of Panorpa germanica TaxID=3066314 RepID=UPI0030CE0B32